MIKSEQDPIHQRTLILKQMNYDKDYYKELCDMTFLIDMQYKDVLLYWKHIAIYLS